jgi:hypothetical protein
VLFRSYIVTPVTAGTTTPDSFNGNQIVNMGSNRMTVPSFRWRTIQTLALVARGNLGSFLFSQATGATYDRYIFTGNSGLHRITGGTIYIVADSVIPSGTGAVVPANTYYIFILGYPGNTTTSSPYRVNGVTRTTTTDPDTQPDATTTNSLWLNGNGSSTTDNSQVAEILFYATNLSVSQCETVEGYLAWKWGLVSNLPANHPFKNAPP